MTFLSFFISVFINITSVSSVFEHPSYQHSFIVGKMVSVHSQCYLSFLFCLAHARYLTSKWILSVIIAISPLITDFSFHISFISIINIKISLSLFLMHFKKFLSYIFYFIFFFPFHFYRVPHCLCYQWDNVCHYQSQNNVALKIKLLMLLLFLLRKSYSWWYFVFFVFPLTLTMK